MSRSQQLVTGIYDDQDQLVALCQRNSGTPLEVGFSGVLARSCQPVVLAGTIAETVAASVNVPGGLLGTNGELHVRFWFTNVGAAIPTLVIRYGGLNWVNLMIPANLGTRGLSIMRSRAPNLQVFPDKSSNASVFDNSSAVALQSIAVDSTVDQSLTIGFIVPGAGDVVTLQAWSVEVVPGS